MTEFEFFYSYEYHNLLAALVDPPGEGETVNWSIRAAFMVYRERGLSTNFGEWTIAWGQELNHCVIDRAHIGPYALEITPSWDRRACYILWLEMRKRGATLNEASDLFA